MNRYLLLLTLLGGAMNCRAAAAPDPLTCVAFRAYSPTVRAEGLAELVADVLIYCNGGTPVALGATVPAFDIKLSFNASVTSKILGTDGKSSEALLLLDEPDSGAQFPCEATDGVCHGEGNGQGYGNAAGDYYGGGTIGLGNNRNIFQGVVGPANTLLWAAIPFDPPGAAALQSRIFRLTNLRLDPTSLSGGAGDLKLTGISMKGP